MRDACVPLWLLCEQADSPDTVSVAEFYSSEMVAFVRRVLEIVPVTVFGILNHIIALQTQMRVRCTPRLLLPLGGAQGSLTNVVLASCVRVPQPLPVKLELSELKAMSQLDARYTLAKTTHHVSVFTEGMLQMKSTLLGIVEVRARARHRPPAPVLTRMLATLRAGGPARHSSGRHPQGAGASDLQRSAQGPGVRPAHRPQAQPGAGCPQRADGSAQAPGRLPPVVRIHPGLHQHVRADHTSR